MSNAITNVRTTSGDVRVAISPQQFEGAFAGAMQEGRPILKIPTIAGAEWFIIHHITGWSAAS